MKLLTDSSEVERFLLLVVPFGTSGSICSNINIGSISPPNLAKILFRSKPFEPWTDLIYKKYLVPLARHRNQLPVPLHLLHRTVAFHFVLQIDHLPSLVLFFGPSGYWRNDQNLSFGCIVIPKNELLIPWSIETFYSVIYILYLRFRHCRLLTLGIVWSWLWLMMFLW